MSEAMLTLTREQLEHWREHLTYIEPQAADEMNALIEMALSSIAMREALKPFTEEGSLWAHLVPSAQVAISQLGHAARIAKFNAGDLRRAAEAYQEQGK